MHEFFFTLSFSIIPLLTAASFAMVTPAFGATLSLRNEILLGIALPPFGAAVIAFLILIGVPPESTIILYIATCIILFLIMVLLPLNVGTRRISLRRRELILAALFCIGNTLTIIFMAISPQAESHFKNLLQGELLAVRGMELIVAAVCALVILIAGVIYRGVIYAFSLDEEGLRIKEKKYYTISIVYRAVATLIITGGIILIGPLLTTSLLIIPAFIAERSTRGLDRFMIKNSLIGLLGILSGFVIAILVDMPPSPVAICMMIVVGLCMRKLF